MTVMVVVMDFPSLARLRARATAKWAHYPADVLPLWVAESDFPTCPAVCEAIREACSNEQFGYPAPTPEFGEALAGFAQRRYGVELTPEWIFPVADVVSGLVLALEAFTDPARPVLIPNPCYPPFLALGELSGRSLLKYHYRNDTTATPAEATEISAFAHPDLAADIVLDLQEIEQLFAAGAGALVLCNPHNPLGVTHSSQQLVKLAELAERYDAKIISDEIHAPLVYGTTHVMAATVSETARRRTITLTAASKAFNVAGLKCAQFITTNAEDASRFAAIHPLKREGYSPLGLAAATSCYSRGDDFLDEELAILEHHRHLVASLVAEHLPGVRYRIPQATYLAWLDCRHLPLDQAPGEFFLQHAKVAVNEGADFGPAGRGFVRLNFATSEEILRQAFAQMGQALVEAGIR
ncbi:MalY/PatB family protein [Corynebacterium choanae]|uniref:cysteine-S-conjugate beta-lyase n=1 Tax=Corynebacterium choanae TaxID=1862358 RepID=A0A3G6J7I7_9CORY|nr:aminotransferase class I/II-fold pyridoxal phosphate-dependent enzyme [Corynebacterium choanae]AZA14081.1 Cystathionine beta-lyase PatB [Corynebacterium choanae]